MILEQAAKNLYISTTAIFASLGLSIMEMLSVLDGILPRLGLIVSLVTAVVVCYYHIRNLKKQALEIRKLQRELDASKH